MDRITVSGNKFMLDGKPFVPIGWNMTRAAIKRMGLSAYMKRAAAAGANVLREIWLPPIKADKPWLLDQAWVSELREIGKAAADHGIFLYPCLIFPTPVNWSTDFLAWPKNPFSEKYPTVDDFFRDGASDFGRYQSGCFDALEGLPVFAVEVVNEVEIKTSDALQFVSRAMAWDVPFPLGFSRPTPYWKDTGLEREATCASDFVAFHSYGPYELHWAIMPEPDLWKRIAVRASHVEDICFEVELKAQGKPFLDSEIPVLPAMNAITDFFHRIFKLPQTKDFDAHFGKVGELYLQHGAASPGLQWAFTDRDITDGQLAQLKRIAEESVK